ncbi:MAG: alpha-2-macroglobulin family protein, partial [Rhodospirillaceae bacterium]|nr:alpha-2-macroglobulin family protein [Rhodospirillaceae bacterium]
MTLLARSLLSALLLLLAFPSAHAETQAPGTAYDTPLQAAASAQLEREVRQRGLKPRERPQAFAAQQASSLGLALVRQRNYVEAVPLLERAIAHGGGTYQVWLAYSNAVGAQRAANHRRALTAAYIAWKKASTNKEKALALYYIGYWHEVMREADASIAAYEDSLKLDNSGTVRNRLNQMVMQYRHQVVQTRADVDGAQPRICLTFSKPLPTRDPAMFARYIAIEPAVKAAFDAKERTLCISGVSFSQNYRITVRQGLPSTGAHTVPRTENFTIAVPDRPTTLAFRAKAYILPKASRQGIPLSTVNAERVEIKVLRINDRELINEIVNERVRETLYEHTARRIQDNQGELVWTGRMRIQSERNKEAVTAIPFADIVKQTKPGIYVVLARSIGKKSADDDSDGDYSEWATQWVVVTDLGVSTYSGLNGLSVFVRSYETAKPRAGVQVRLIARNNEVLGTAETDAAGRANFAPGLMRGQGGNRAAAVMMSTADGEFTFIDIIRTAFDLTDRGVGGREAPGGADAFVYTERGVYRPGETVHMTALLRDINAAAIGDTPLVVRLMRPDGVEARRFVLKPTGAGGYTVSIPLAKSVPTGAWRLLAHVDPKGPAVGSVGFKVEDFVPERLEMTLAADPKIVAPGKPVKIAVAGRFLYGAPAADLPVDGEATIKIDGVPFAAFKDFTFGLVQERFNPKRIEIESVKTDAKGNASLTLGLDDKFDSSRPLVADIRVTLNEEGGRAIERRLSVPVAHRPLYLGLKLDAEDGTVAEGQPAKFQLVAVDREGTRKAANKLAYALVREVWEYQWYSQDGRWNYRAVRRDEPVQKGELDLAADKPAELSFKTAEGRYRLEVTDPATGASASYRYSVGWVYAGAADEEVPDKLQVRLDKPAYKAGETAKISIKAPFNGIAHIVVASDRVLVSRHVAVAPGGTEIEVPVDGSWGTGVYVLATAYRPNGKAERLGPSRAIGVAYLARDTADRVLSVKIDAPETMRPRGKLDVKLAVDGARGEPVFVTVAAVDQGVLALTSYKTPAPDAYFYGKRKLALEIRDDYGRLIDAYAGRLGEIRQGGDAEARHTGGLDVSSIKVVSLYSGIVRVDEKGQATVSLDVPDFNGRLRVMAVAWTANRVGKADRDVTVRDPVVTTVTLPRFLAPGDHGRVTVVLHNVDGPAGAYRVRLTAGGQGAATIAGAADQPVLLNKDQRQRLAFVLSGVRPGTATVDLQIDGPGNFSLARHWDIAVRPAQTNVARYLVSQLDKGAVFTLGAKEIGEMLPGTAALYLTVGNTPDLGVADLLASLDRYPYGCAEQTTSRALPLLYLADIAKSIGVVKDDVALRDRVQQAIYRVFAMQARDGGFGMWSSFDAAGGWLTAFVMDFLTQARAKGYVVPDIGFEQGLKRLDSMTRDLSYDAPSLAVLAYAHYVLAANKKGDVAAVRYLYDTQLKEMPTALAKAQLGATLALFG